MIKLSQAGQARNYWLELCSSLSGSTLSTGMEGPEDCLETIFFSFLSFIFG
jgi:hypothetical protein